MENLKMWWEKVGVQVSLGCLIALVTGLLSIGVWVGRVQADVQALSDLPDRVTAQEIQDARIETDLQWIKTTLVRIDEKVSEGE